MAGFPGVTMRPTRTRKRLWRSQTAGGVDADAVYVQDSRKRIDRESFRLLNPIFAVDHQAAYDWKGAIKGADPKTFETLDSGTVRTEDDVLPAIEMKGYARDRSQVYFHDQMEGRAAALRSADVSTFHSFGNGFGADSNSVFLGKVKLPKADPKTWMYLGHGYSMDNTRVWFLNREIRNVLRSTFCVINLPYHQSFATDGRSWFQQCGPISEAEFHKKIKSIVGHLAKSVVTNVKQVNPEAGAR